MEQTTVTPQMQHEVRTHGTNVERMALRVLRDHGTPGEALQRAQEMYDRVIAKVDARYRPGYACKPGCAHCCAAEVTVSPPEADLLVSHVQQSMTAEQIEELKQRMRGVIAARQAGGRARCAFLGPDSLCTVYAIRPMKCRACNALDVEPCMKWEEGKDDSSAARVFMLPRLYSAFTVFGVLQAASPAANPAHVPHTELMATLLARL